MESALVPVGSASKPEPGWAAEDVALALPLEVSSSVRVVPPPEERRPRRWLKELLYLDIGAGLGEAELEEAMAFSGEIAIGLRVKGPVVVGGGIFLESELPVGGVRAVAEEIGGSTNEGEADRGGALNGWKDIEGRLTTPDPPSPASTAARPAGPILAAGRSRLVGDDGDGDVVPSSLAALRVEIGLALGGPTWWKVERLPYARVGSGCSVIFLPEGSDPTSF